MGKRQNRPPASHPQEITTEVICCTGELKIMSGAVITGLGPVAPSGLGKGSFWESFKTGRSGIRYFSRYPNNGTVQIVGEVPREWFINGTPFDERKQAWSTFMVIQASHLALEDAGLDNMSFAARPSGIRVGISTIDMEVGEREYEHFKVSGATQPMVVASSFPHAPASVIARELKCSGRVFTSSAACTAGTLSIISAAESIASGDTEVQLAGGGDAPLTPFMISCMHSSGLHPAVPEGFNGKPQELCKPFDARRNGGVMGEGAGMVLLENDQEARRRGAKIYGRILGWGISNANSPFSLRTAFASAMEQALQMARLKPDAIDYISAHAPGIKISDKEEVKAIKQVFGPHAYHIPVSSIKGTIGNPLAAAGPLQLISALLAMEHQFVPPTLNYSEPDPACDLDCVPNRGRTARLKTAMVNSFGIGGGVASLIVERF